MLPDSNQRYPEDFRYTVSLTAFSASQLHVPVTRAWDIQMHNQFFPGKQLALAELRDLEASLHFTFRLPGMRLYTGEHFILI